MITLARSKPSPAQGQTQQPGDRDMGTAIRTIREAGGHDATTVARMAGISGDRYWEIEIGVAGLGFDELIAITEVLDVRLTAVVATAAKHLEQRTRPAGRLRRVLRLR